MIILDSREYQVARSFIAQALYKESVDNPTERGRLSRSSRQILSGILMRDTILSLLVKRRLLNPGHGLRDDAFLNDMFRRLRQSKDVPSPNPLSFNEVMRQLDFVDGAQEAERLADDIEFPRVESQEWDERIRILTQPLFVVSPTPEACLAFDVLYEAEGVSLPQFVYMIFSRSDDVERLDYDRMERIADSFDRRIDQVIRERGRKSPQ